MKLIQTSYKKHGQGHPTTSEGAPHSSSEGGEYVKDGAVEEHRSLDGIIISRLGHGAFIGLIYSLLVFS